MTLLIIVQFFLYAMDNLRASMHAHDASCHSICQCGHRSGCQKLCAVGLVGA